MDLSDKGDGMKQLLLSELAATELRAQRSLRVLEHQEGRLAALENGLQHQCTNLHDLQGYHSDLLEVHQRQLEVQGLQRELIKLQEIQYLTKMSNLENANDQESTANAIQNKSIISSSPPVEKSPPPLAIPPGRIDQGEGLIFHKCPVPHRKSTPLGVNLFQVNALKMNHNLQPSTDKYEKKQIGRVGPIPNNEDMSYFGTKLKRNLSIGKNEGHDHEPEESQKTAKIPAGESQMLKTTIHTRTGRCENKEEDDIMEKITILRERLSSHRIAIDSLSSEILDLRKELVEVLTYLKNLLDWKVKVESSLKNVGIHLNIKKGSKVDGNGNPMLTPITDTKVKSAGQGMQMNLSASPFILGHIREDEEAIPGKPGNLKSLTVEHSKLGERANQIWDLACRFLTPQQAHYILTSPIPFGERESSGEDE